MLQSTKKKHFNIHGFTLVELLVAVAILGVISVISVKGLYDIVSIRAKQQTIEDSSDSFRVVTRLLTKAITEAENVDVIETGSAIQIKKTNLCQTIKYVSEEKAIFIATDITNGCSPPGLSDPNYTNLTSDDFVIDSFTISPTGTSVNVVSIGIEGYYKNSLGDHPFTYSTSVSKRI